MKRNELFTSLIIITLLTVFALAVGPLSGSPIQAQSSDDPETIEKGEVIVEIKPGASIVEVNERNRTETIEQLRGTNFYRLQIPQNKSEKKWRKRLERDPDVLIASLNPLVTTVFGRSVMSYPDGHAQLNHTKAEYLAQRESFNQLKLVDSHLRSSGEGVVVAVIDTGVDYTHPDLASHMWTNPKETPGAGKDNDNDGLRDDVLGWDFIGRDNDPMDDPGDTETTVAGHGTFIAGLIALAAPDARIMPIRAFRQDGSSNVFYIAAAMTYAVSHGANVINLSCGTTEPSPVLEDAIKAAREQGVIVVAAVGNQGTAKNPQYPANYVDDVIGVAAVNQNDVVTYFSNYGTSVSVTALGQGLISAFPGGKYARWSGTSFATPLVAAEAALVLASDNDSTKTRGFIEDTASNIDGLNPRFAGMLGKGRIDPLAALQSIIAQPVVDLYAAVVLNHTQDESPAQGLAEIAIVDAVQVLKVSATGLTPHASHRLVVDGVDAVAPGSSELVANDFGGLEVTLVNVPGGANQLPDLLDPVTTIRHVELRNKEGLVLIQNDFRPVENLAPKDEFLLKQARLASPNASTRAIGVAKVETDEASLRLRVEIERLPADGTYDIIADGVMLTTATARSGFIRADFTTDASSGQPLPPSLLPAINIKRVDVRDSTGQTGLSGSFKLESGGIGRSR